MAPSSMDSTVGESRRPAQSDLDPRGEIHLPIGLPNAVDTLKTFVEAEGCFSPGFGSYGICFWLHDIEGKRLFAPTMKDLRCERGLSPEGFPIPWSEWDAAGVRVRSEVCQVRRASPAGEFQVVAVRVRLANPSRTERRVALFAALRPLGPAGWAVKALETGGDDAALLADGHPALVASQAASAAGVSCIDDVGRHALAGDVPPERAARSPDGDCSGALRFDMTLPANGVRELGFVCPVLPGRRAVGHAWAPGGENNYRETARLNPDEGGQLQPDPGLDGLRGLRVEALFDEARRYWKERIGRVALNLPDPRWNQAFAAIAGHVALCLNEGAPDVSAINYTTFNRDGVYNVNILQKAGVDELAVEAVEHFLAHPFNGRPYPEADNPGQDLWILGQQWLFTKDRAWLERVYPAARKLAALIRYVRTTPEPHWVELDGLRFGDEVPIDRRHQLEPGSCDGRHPEYTEAFDVAGLRAAAELAGALGLEAEAVAHRTLAEELFARYDRRFGSELANGYGRYCVLWPCRLYPLGKGKGFDRFRSVGRQKPNGWRYFPLATAHQGLLAGHREAAYGTLEEHLAHPQMRGWYVLDEGGDSGVGGWDRVRTTWNGKVAMPHGWAVAEFFLLLRDSLAFEDEGRLVLLGGVPEAWFRPQSAWSFAGLPTHFGRCGVTVTPDGNNAVLSLTGAMRSGRVALRLPATIEAVRRDGRLPERDGNGDVLLPADVREVVLERR